MIMSDFGLIDARSQCSGEVNREGSLRRKRVTQRMKRGLFGSSAVLPVIAVAGLAAVSVLTAAPASAVPVAAAHPASAASASRSGSTPADLVKSTTPADVPYALPVQLPSTTSSPAVAADAPYTPAVLNLIAQLEPSNPPTEAELANASILFHGGTNATCNNVGRSLPRRRLAAAIPSSRLRRR